MRRLALLLLPALMGPALMGPLAAQDAAKKVPAKKAPAKKAAKEDPARERALREYRARAKKLAKSDVVGHFKLAQWCDRKQLPRCARWELHEVLREAPDHAGARQRLGQVFYDGKWMKEADAMRKQGKVFVDGKWRTKYEAAKARFAMRKRLKLQHQANLLLARLADRSARTRAQALIELELMSRKEKWPELAKVARRKAREFGDYWHRRLLTTHTGLVTVRATQSQLLEMKPFTTSLGTGAPVRLQLPQMRTVSIGTTVALPLGRGR